MRPGAVRWLLAAAGVGLAAAAATALPSPDLRGEKGRPAGTKAAPAAAAAATDQPTPAPRDSRDPEDLPAGSRRDRHRVTTAARRFARAFARYEVGDLTGPVVLELRRAARPELVRELLRNPVRPAGPGTPRRARVGDVGSVRIQRDSAWVVVGLRRGARRAGLALRLERAPGRFLVTRIA